MGMNWSISVTSTVEAQLNALAVLDWVLRQSMHHEANQTGGQTNPTANTMMVAT